MTVVGEVRPSQLMFSFGVGATLDLPAFSALVMGLDFWDKDACPPVSEPRLLAAVRRIIGNAVRELRLAPVQPDENNKQSDRGVPVVPFPRWMRCTRCGMMAPLEDNLFEKREFRRQPIQFVHTHCPSIKNDKYPPLVLPVRFLFACSAGHLSDIPWNDFVHDGNPCLDPHLRMNEYGVTGDVSDITVTCENCGKKKNLKELIGKPNDKQPLFKCSGLHPHLRMQYPCEERTHLVNLGASNLWFPQTVSVLSIPDKKSVIIDYVRAHWADLEDVDSLDVVKYLTKSRRLAGLEQYAPEAVLQAIQTVKSNEGTDNNPIADDIKLPEWEIFIGDNHVEPTHRLEICPVDAPKGFDGRLASGMLIPRLSEVRTMYGFTRLNTQQELDLGIVTPQQVAPVTRSSPEWLPAYESHGEGFFLRLREDVLQAWEQRQAVQEYANLFFQSHKAWRQSRKFENTEDGFPGMRYILLHSFAHALMQQIVLDCGYTAASIRERLYCRSSDIPGGPMAGLLIYTAATDSEGTLGGLVSLGQPEILGRYISHALENMRLCSSDPLCAERSPVADGRGIHGAACHACLFAPETSCECGNRYLDRNVLVRTFANRPSGLAFWDD